MADESWKAAELRVECLKLAVPLTHTTELDREGTVVKIASTLYNFVVAGDKPAETSPDRTLHLGSKRK